MDRETLRTSLTVVALLLASLYVLSVADCSLPEVTGDSIVREGDTLTLQCSCNDSNWTFNGHSLPENAVVDEDDGSLIITEADHTLHDGSYACTVNNIPSEEFQVTVQYIGTDISICEVREDGEVLPGFLNPYYDNYIYSSFVGSNVSLRCCPPEGKPTPTITWDLHNEFVNDVRYSNDNSLLIIDSLSAFGEFTCTATNPAGTTASNFIYLLAGVPVVEDSISVIAPRFSACGKVGGSAEMKCIVSGPATTEVKWETGGIELTDGLSRYAIDEENTLEIFNLFANDAGIYTCSASAPDLESDSVRIELDLNCIRSVTLVPEVVNIGLGRDLTLTCEVSKSQDLLSAVLITWTSPNGTTYTGPTLTINSVQYHDGGTYQCTASTDNAPSASSSNVVYVEGPPTIEIITSEREAKLNHEFVLTCVTNATRSPRFEWYWRDINRTSPEQYLSQSSTFTITEFETSDIGTYRCSMYDEIHLPLEASVDVLLTKDIYLYDELDNQEFIIDRDVSISCNVIGGEGELDVLWYNGSTLITTNEKTQIIDRTNTRPSMLHISSLSLSDEGQYFCVATDEMSRMFNHSFLIIVNVPGTLVGMVPPGPNVTIEVGSRVELQCIVDGKPKPVVNWRRDVDFFLNSNSRYIINRTNGTLIIPHALIDDSDSYGCLFQRSDTGGVVDKEFKLNVVSRQEETSTTEGNRVLGLQLNVFIAIVLGALGGFFILLTCLLICCFICSRCCRALKNHQRRRPVSPVTRLEVTTFERRPSMRGSTRKDNSGILQSSANARWSLSSDARSNTNTVAMTTASSSLAISPAPPVPSPVPPPAGPTASLATEIVLPPGVSNFPRQNLKLGNVMGEGEFGPVYRAIARKISNKEEESIVAVKILMPREGDEDYQPEVALGDFASQMKLSSDYVASIVGICADAEPYYVIYQYLSEGDLKQYLTTHRPSPQVQPVLTQADLMHLITQVSHGMSYLYSQQIIHGDLASRNCLIGADLSIKIADLGIGHDLYPNDYYDNGTQLLPIRWMAAELLAESTEGPAFSLASDVWAFGIFCWEVFAYGRQPYDSMSDEQVLRLVPHGHLLNAPEEGCPPLLFTLMQDCWSATPEQRPSFSEITTAILNIDVD